MHNPPGFREGQQTLPILLRAGLARRCYRNPESEQRSREEPEEPAEGRREVEEALSSAGQDVAQIQYLRRNDSLKHCHTAPSSPEQSLMRRRAANDA